MVEVEITSVDEGKVERYADLGVRELWRLRGRPGAKDMQADFLALDPGAPPVRLAASRVLGGLTPGDVWEAVHRVRVSATLDECKATVARIVGRRRAGMRVREGDAPYAATAG